MTNDTIGSVLHETRTFHPPQAFVDHARITPDRLTSLREEADRDPEGFWGRLAQEEIDWHKPFPQVLDSSRAPRYTWFEGGELNVSVNCLDRHLARRGQKTAIIAEGEKGDVRVFTYASLHREVCRLANGLRKLGARKGDRIILLMPNVPEAVIAMQACARIGALHSVVFGGFSAESLKSRIEDANARFVITADGGHRGGKIIELKSFVDKALSTGCKSVRNVVVLKRTDHGIAMDDKRDVWWHDLVANVKDTCDPAWVDAEHPLFLLYTSGSTGRPKGIVHASGGYLLGALLTSKWVFDLQASDVFWCTADVGWITGHSYVAYGPLAAGATILMYEGAPTEPHGGRFWEICEKHGVTIFYTAPTAIRALMRLGDDIPAKYDLSKLRLLGSVGEPINPEAWMWYHRVIGGARCPIVDTWWQTETGSIMMSPIPGAVVTKPGSCTFPLPGIDADVVDEEGERIQSPEEGGYLVIKRPWPSMARTIYGDDARYQETYWNKFNNRYYVAGDSAHRDAEGYFWILGRNDDVIKVSGHRLGSMEIESALCAHPNIAEAAVVGRPDALTGEAVVAFVVPKGARPEGDAATKLTIELRAWVTEQIGALARPAEIRYGDNLPKTRSGKIMRRLLRSLAAGEVIAQDTSTLENASILAQLAA